MRTAGYSVTAECSAPLKTYESCMKIADQIKRGPSGNQYRDADWNKICLDDEWDVRTQKRLSVDCYQSGSWWAPLAGSVTSPSQDQPGSFPPPWDIEDNGAGFVLSGPKRAPMQPR
jgi:hypothetical protein